MNSSKPNTLSLFGTRALSPFREERLLKRARRFAPGLTGVASRFVYFVRHAGELPPGERKILNRLLQSREPDSENFSLLILPRPGTITPWSNKATDIARLCGLQGIARIERGVGYSLSGLVDAAQLRAGEPLAECFYDRMTEAVAGPQGQQTLFAQPAPGPLCRVNVLDEGMPALERVSRDMGLALAEEEIHYLYDYFVSRDRNPTDAELMMFAQVNSEHCRHKIFNADWLIDGETDGRTLFGMIRATHEKNPAGTLVAYSDNASVISGREHQYFAPHPTTREYGFHESGQHVLMKVETHNHPTAIAPFPGASTGSGGEIRDEGATGRGGRPKAGLCGFSVSNLFLPEAEQPWEHSVGRPERIRSALDIMLEGPVGAAAFNNEFGRPNICGYFRTFEQEHNGHHYGYHKPIMIAGGVGAIDERQVRKQPLTPGALLLQLGGPGMLIGVGGGAASSMEAGENRSDLDFNSVQRDNPEMQRRCQEVINHCQQMADNPILSIHDVGAGGLSNALPELVNDWGLGAVLELSRIPIDDPSMSPLQIWCNESQERYVLGIDRARLPEFVALCERERCPYAVLGETIREPLLRVLGGGPEGDPVHMDMRVLLGRPPKMVRQFDRRKAVSHEAKTPDNLNDIQESVRRLLALPTIADKSFLIHIGDRSVGGLVARDQLVGPWQTPVSDVAVTCSGFSGYGGEAMSMGERSPAAILNPAAAARMAVTEAITNLVAADVESPGGIRLSANWMAACGTEREDRALFEAVAGITEEFCPELGISIPVGKDSLSMKTHWREKDKPRAVASPVSLVVSAFAPVRDVRNTLTPQLQLTQTASELWLIDLGEGRNRLGGSCLAQVFNQIGDHPPDLQNPALLKGFFRLIRLAADRNLLLAYHDRSDGGLMITMLEMAFAGRCGLDLDLSGLSGGATAILFSEEAGAVVQIETSDREAFLAMAKECGLSRLTHRIGSPTAEENIVLYQSGRRIFEATRADLQKRWSSTSYHIKSLRDNPQTSAQEYQGIEDTVDPGLRLLQTFAIQAPRVRNSSARPRVAILREQGVNGQVEMAAAFHLAGFSAVDVHMSDIIDGRTSLAGFHGLAACGGFSFGDVLGAGRGWAQSILHNERAREEFAAFFQRGDSFALGVCNGCQMMAHLKELIPGTEHWPEFERNLSEQFESRLVQVRIESSPSVLLAGMGDSLLPVVVAHGEGRAGFSGPACDPVLTYVGPNGAPTERFPHNPNGSPGGLAGVTNRDGRFTIMMPHPERLFRSVQYSWLPQSARDIEAGPWMQLFHNARAFVG